VSVGQPLPVMVKFPVQVWTPVQAVEMEHLPRKQQGESEGHPLSVVEPKSPILQVVGVGRLHVTLGVHTLL